MSRGTVQHKLLVMNPDGFHLRPAGAFAELAQKFQSTVVVSKDGGPAADGKSPWNLMGLAALQGSELTVEASGPDAEEALNALVEMLAGHAIVEAPPLPPKG
jgi:phosphocarrier protein HPr